MDISKIEENLPVHARNPGVVQGPCAIKIGTVERVESNGYIKLAPNYPLIDGQGQWFPIDWIESVTEEIVCLNQSADIIMARLVEELPTDT